MSGASKIETLHATFNKPHHVFIMGVPTEGVSDEPNVQHLGTTRPFDWEEPSPFGRLSGSRAHRLST